MEDIKEIVPYRHNRTVAHINSQRLSHETEHAWASHRWGSTTERISRCKTSSLTYNLTLIVNHSQLKNQFFSVNLTESADHTWAPFPAKWSTQKEFNGLFDCSLSQFFVFYLTSQVLYTYIHVYVHILQFLLFTGFLCM